MKSGLDEKIAIATRALNHRRPDPCLKIILALKKQDVHDRGSVRLKY